MIYKAIIEEVINRYTVKVRIPLIHRTSLSSQYTDINGLPEAKIATLPNTHPNIQVGDVVVVGLENNDPTKPVIIGYLYKEALTNALVSPKFSSLEVMSETKLSGDTSIGDVTSENIKQLQGCTENIYQKFKEIINRLDSIEKDLYKNS